MSSKSMSGMLRANQGAIGLRSKCLSAFSRRFVIQSGSPFHHETARQMIDQWRNEAAEATVMSASAVQDRLFELWGELRDLPQVAVVEQWLTLTIDRELFSGTELVEFLDELDLSLDSVVPATTP